MGYRYSFIDNETYGVDDINGAVSRLTTSGVTFYPTDENLTDAMNAITSDITSGGVEFNHESCLVTVNDDEVTVSSGTVFFDDGVSLVIDSQGVTLPYSADAYVYAYRDVGLNSCDIRITKALPTKNYVLFAYIDSDGAVHDRRQYAVSKIAPNSAPNLKNVTLNIEYGNNFYERKVAEFTIGYSAFQYIVFKSSSPVEVRGFCKLTEGDYSEKCTFYKDSTIRFKKDREKVEIYIKDGFGYTYNSTLEMILI